MSALDTQVGATLAERGKRYGDFTDHARICQSLKQIMMRTPGWGGRVNDVQRQALEVIADKIARILNGDPNYADNWHDIQGYAKLAEDRLPVEEESIPVAEVKVATLADLNTWAGLGE